MSCAIRIVHMEKTRSPVWPQNQLLRFISGLASKPLQYFLDLDLKIKVDGLVIWTSKSP
jgi:hypothetical protein